MPSVFSLMSKAKNAKSNNLSTRSKRIRRRLHQLNRLRDKIFYKSRIFGISALSRANRTGKNSRRFRQTLPLVPTVCKRCSMNKTAVIVTCLSTVPIADRVLRLSKIFLMAAGRRRYAIFGCATNAEPNMKIRLTAAFTPNRLLALIADRNCF